MQQILKRYFGEDVSKIHPLKMAVEAAIVPLLLDEEDEDQSIAQSSKTWVPPWIQNHQNAGAFHTLFLELKLDEQAFTGYLRMDKT